MTIYEKLMLIQCELKAPKSQFNSFGKYNYRNCEDILEALKPICTAHKAVTYLTDDVTVIGERTYVKATAALVDAETGERVENHAFAREEETKKGMDGSQVTGASSSYARKYALNGLFGIDDTKDSDTTNTGDYKPKQPANPPQPLTPVLVGKDHMLVLANELTRTGWDVGSMLDYVGKKFNCKLNKIEEMTIQQFTWIMSALKKKPDKAAQNGPAPLG